MPQQVGNGAHAGGFFCRKIYLLQAPFNAHAPSFPCRQSQITISGFFLFFNLTINREITKHRFYQTLAKRRQKNPEKENSRVIPRGIIIPLLDQTSLLGYATLVVALNSSLMLLILTNRPRMLMLPALSLVPLALLPPNGCWPTTAPVLLQLT